MPQKKSNMGSSSKRRSSSDRKKPSGASRASGPRKTGPRSSDVGAGKKGPSRTGATSRPSAPPSRSTSRPASVGEETQAKLDELQDKLGQLQESLLLTSAQNDLADVETTLAVLPSEIERLRTRGYVFRSYLENKIEVLAGQWEETHDRASREINKRVRELEREADEAESAMRQALSGSASQISRAEAAINTLESKTDAARSAVDAIFGKIQDNVRQTKAQVDEIRWTLDQVDEAGFQLHPAEDPVAACEAQYMETKKEGPKGVLYLTDERLLFEQKEEVATKKVLFITTEKEKVQELFFDEHIGHVEEVKTSQKGFLGHKEIMEILFTPEADLSSATIRLHSGDNEAWAALIGRVKSGEITKERTKPKDEAAVEAARTAPTKCSTCGATLDVEIVRGMREITCEYCGSVIRL